MNKILFAAASVTVLSGCASITGDQMQTIQVDGVSSEGQPVIGADCKLSNDYGTFATKTGEAAMVRRSSKDMQVLCVDRSTQTNALGTVISRANSGMFGNIIFGGGIGAIMDHANGKGYGYPQWIRVVFGRTLFFDRMREKAGQPVIGEPTAPK